MSHTTTRRFQPQHSFSVFSATPKAKPLPVRPAPLKPAGVPKAVLPARDLKGSTMLWRSFGPGFGSGQLVVVCENNEYDVLAAFVPCSVGQIVHVSSGAGGYEGKSATFFHAASDNIRIIELHADSVTGAKFFHLDDPSTRVKFDPSRFFYATPALRRIVEEFGLVVTVPFGPLVTTSGEAELFFVAGPDGELVPSAKPAAPHRAKAPIKATLPAAPDYVWPVPASRWTTPIPTPTKRFVTKGPAKPRKTNYRVTDSKELYALVYARRTERGEALKLQSKFRSKPFVGRSLVTA